MSKRKNRFRVLIADDFSLARDFFATGLRREGSFDVLEASGGNETMTALKAWSVDAVFLNISMRHSSGMNLLQQVHHEFPDIGILAYSYLHHDQLYAERALCAGASGYISIDEPGVSLVQALRLVAGGQLYLNPELRQKLCLNALQSPDRRNGSPFDRLSQREFEVFCLTGHGYVPKRIAERLKVSVKTVETYRERIREKLGLSEGGDLLYYASQFMREQSLLQPVRSQP